MTDLSRNRKAGVKTRKDSRREEKENRVCKRRKPPFSNAMRKKREELLYYWSSYNRSVGKREGDPGTYWRKVADKCWSRTKCARRGRSPIEESQTELSQFEGRKSLPAGLQAKELGASGLKHTL